MASLAFTLSLRARILMALVSAVGVALVRFLAPELDTFVGAVLFYGLSGLFFAAGVLFPYVKPGRSLIMRASLLIALSALSYWCAIGIALGNPIPGTSADFRLFGYAFSAFVLASISGTAIVMTALVLCSPVRASARYVLFGLTAAVVGGPVTAHTLPATNPVIVGLGHGAWHLLICLAIFFGRGADRRNYQATP